MKVLTLIPSQKGYSPGQRGSIELWEKILQPAGIELNYAPFETEKLQQILYTSGNHMAKEFPLLYKLIISGRICGKSSCCVNVHAGNFFLGFKIET